MHLKRCHGFHIAISVRSDQQSMRQYGLTVPQACSPSPEDLVADVYVADVHHCLLLRKRLLATIQSAYCIESVRSSR
jgi:hypothetical protein